jgi:SH3-like domain-containing protein
MLRSKLRNVFFNGFMYMLEYFLIVVVDMEANTWRKIRKPCGAESSIHQAQGLNLDT